MRVLVIDPDPARAALVAEGLAGVQPLEVRQMPTLSEAEVANFAPDVIRKALDRVRRTRSLRKNRTALFRYLLTKLS